MPISNSIKQKAKKVVKLMKTYLLSIFALLIVGWRKRTDFDKGAYNRPFEKVGPILSNDEWDRIKNR